MITSIKQHIENFKIRRTTTKYFKMQKKLSAYKELTKELIDSTSDEWVVWLVFSNISSKFHSSDKGVERVELTTGQSVIYTTWLLEADVHNGGFNQAYYNQGPEIVEKSITGFMALGAPEHSALVERAHNIYTNMQEKLEEQFGKSRGADSTLESFQKSYENNPLNDLDKEFYALPNLFPEEDLQALMIRYIREHVSEFI
jgi:hypothetical protein